MRVQCVFYEKQNGLKKRFICNSMRWIAKPIFLVSIWLESDNTKSKRIQPIYWQKKTCWPDSPQGYSRNLSLEVSQYIGLGPREVFIAGFWWTNFGTLMKVSNFPSSETQTLQASKYLTLTMNDLVASLDTI